MPIRLEFGFAILAVFMILSSTETLRAVSPPDSRLRVAVAQIPVTRDIAANEATILRAIGHAVAERADVLLTSGRVTSIGHITKRISVCVPVPETCGSPPPTTAIRQLSPVPPHRASCGPTETGRLRRRIKAKRFWLSRSC